MALTITLTITLTQTLTSTSTLALTCALLFHDILPRFSPILVKVALTALTASSSTYPTRTRHQPRYLTQL